MKEIVVLSYATRTSGGYMIYKQFIEHLQRHMNGYKYYIIVDPNMVQPIIQGVTYIHEQDHSWKRRIYMNHKGWRLFFKERNINPSLIISLQNTGIKTIIPQIIYYHTSLSFYPNKWNPLKRDEITMFLYKHVYPFFVKSTLSPNTHVVVQIPFIKKAFSNYYNWPSDKIHVMFPDLDNLDINRIRQRNYSVDECHFIYPAVPVAYKQHATIVKAVKIIKKKDMDLASKLRIYFTIKESDMPLLSKMIKKLDLTEQFIFEGVMPHEKLLEYYNSSKGLLFPSSIESLGLPLLEAARFGLPIIASDLDYVKEVLDGYEGVRCASHNDYEKWADLMVDICKNNKSINPLPNHNSSWPDFFELADNIIEGHIYRHN